MSDALPLPHAPAKLDGVEVSPSPLSLQSEKSKGAAGDLPWWVQPTAPAKRLDAWNATDRTEKLKRPEDDLFVYRENASSAWTTFLPARQVRLRNGRPDPKQPEASLFAIEQIVEETHFLAELSGSPDDLKQLAEKLGPVLGGQRWLRVGRAGALIFETNRQDARDPRIAGEVMERRLRDRGVEKVKRVAFLTGNAQLEDPSNEVDAVVRRSVVATLSSAINLATANLKPDDRVFVATTGGLPAANELINELVRLHCVRGPSVTALEVPDGDRAQQGDRAVEEKFHPATGYRARWHALSLVEKGNLLGAWGAVSHLVDEPGQEWTQVIQWLALFASSLPLPTACDLAVLNHQRMAVRAGLRVELALRSPDIPRAVHGTVAFFEAALCDRLGERIERSPDPKKRRFFMIKSGEAPTGDKLLRKSDGFDDDRKCPFELKETVDGVAWYWVYDGDGGPGARLAKYFLQSEALTKFDTALVRGSIRELRNDIAHNEPTPELMSGARNRMQTAALWSSTDTFLSQPLVQAVLKELGEKEPEKLLVNLLAEVRRRLVALD